MQSKNKIVLRFYITPAAHAAGSIWRKANIPIPTAQLSEIFTTLRQAVRYQSCFYSTQHLLKRYNWRCRV